MKTGNTSASSLMRALMIGLLLLVSVVATRSAHATGGNPDLRISMSHLENFDIGGLGIYTIKVDNTEGTADIPLGTTATVTITLPRGLTAEPQNFAVNGWTCNATPVLNADDQVVCTNTQEVFFPPNEPNSYSDLTLTVLVDKNEYNQLPFPDQLTSLASVSISGEIDTSDNQTSDLTLIDKSDLVVTAVSFSPAQPIAGEAFDVLVTVRNNGTAATESVVVRSVFVDKHPLASDPDGCATYPPTPADTSDWDRGELNDQIVPDGEIEQPVNASGLNQGTYQIYVMVDATCINTESNESNNIYGPISLTVIDPTPPPVECGHVFGDVPTNYWACTFIETLYRKGVTGGCSTSPTLLYCPDDYVTRGQMAVFLERGIHTSQFTPPDSASSFTDTVGHWAAKWIEALKNDKITSGCLASLYCPDSYTTRDQMAVFLLKSKNYPATYVPPALGGSTGFGDVPTTHWAAAWIKQLAAEAITSGCGGTSYCPDSVVTRAQMAVFLVRTFNLK